MSTDPTTLPAPTVLRTDQAAAYLNLSRSTLEKLRCSGDGPPFVRLANRTIAYRLEALDRWLRSKEHRSTSEYGGSAA